MSARAATGASGAAASVIAKIRHAATDDARGRVLLTLSEILERHHPELAVHGHEVARGCALAGLQLGIPEARRERLTLAGFLHDIGKIAIPRHVLEKQGPLTAAESSRVEAHSEIGAQLLRAAGLEDLAGWVLTHHERIDGRGYPLGLEGSEIPLESRIIAVADAFDAMRRQLRHRSALGREEAIHELRREAGSQFDPDVVEAFVLSPELA